MVWLFFPQAFFIAVINGFLFFDPVCFFLVFVLHYGRASPAQEFRQRNAYLIVVPRCQEGKRNYYGTLVCGQRAVVGFFIHMRFSIFLFLPRPWPLTWCRPTKYSWFLPKFRSTNIAKQAGAIPLYFFFPLGLHDLLTVLIIPDVKMLVAHQPETVFAHMCSGAVASTAESRQNFRVDQLVVY